MSANSHTPPTPPMPGPRCAVYQPLLPILRADGVDARTAEEIGAHLTTCAYCRAALATYDALDASLRRHFAPPTATDDAPDALDTATLLVALDLDAPDTPDGLRAFSVVVHDAGPTPARDSGALPPRRLRGTLSGMGSLAAVLLIAVLTQLLFASHGRPPAPRGVGSQVGPGDPAGTPTVIAVAPGTYQALNAVSMVSPEEGWAVGTATNFATKDTNWSTLLYHYQHGHWSQEQVPSVGTFSAMQMLSPTDGWIAGDQGLLHYDGVSWHFIAPDPQIISGFFGPLAMLSATEGWVVAGGNTLVHYHNGQWSAQAITTVPGISGSPGVNIRALRMLSPTEGWAVGDATPPAPQPQSPSSSSNVPQPLPIGLILRYDGGQWRVASTYPHASFFSIGLLAPDHGWIGGGDFYGLDPPYRGLQASNPLLLTLAHGTWSRATLPSLSSDSSLVDGIAAQPGFGAWLLIDRGGGGPVSMEGGTATALGGTLLLHERQGQWVPVPMPPVRDRDAAFVRSISMVSPEEGWAVGSASWPQALSATASSMPNTMTPLILHYQHGAWSIVAS